MSSTAATRKTPARTPKRFQQRIKKRVNRTALTNLALLGGAYDVSSESKDLIEERLLKRTQDMANLLQILRTVDPDRPKKTVTVAMVKEAARRMGVEAYA